MLIAAALALAACDGAPTATPTPTPTLRPSQTPFIPQLPALDLTNPAGVSDPTAAAAPNDESVPVTVEIAAADGLVLRGWYYPPASLAPGVLLFHDAGRDRQDWNLLAVALQNAGLAVLSMDLRGYGATGGAPDWSLARDDAQVMLEWLREQPRVDARVATVGAGTGANLALAGCAGHELCAAAMLLSPGDNDAALPTAPALGALGARAVFTAASGDDAEAATALDALAAGPHQLQLYRDSGHGTDLLNAEPGLQEQVVNWLVARLTE
jgi:alpha-beta hydrolase superfamily lysophospholipase